MSYSQNAFGARLGTGPFSIAEAGCFLTAFCNLLERFGNSVAPDVLNNFFIKHGNYVDVDGDRTMDDLAWGTVSAYDGNIAVARTGTGYPSDTNDAILKVSYKSPRSGRQTIHFVLLVDHTNGTILDSWDGQVKRNPYGTPVAYAVYEHHAAQVVSPPPPPTALPFHIEHIAEVTKEIKIPVANLWDMNQRTWQDLVNHPVGSAGKDTPFKTSAIAHHIAGGSYYLLDPNGTQGYNVVDTEDPEPVAPVAPPEPVVVAPEAPKNYAENTINGIHYEAEPSNPVQMWITNPAGAEKWNLTGVKSWRDFKSVQHFEYGAEIFVTGVAHHPIPPVGADYFMTNDDFGDFRKTGHPTNNFGFNHSDVSTTRPQPAIPAVAPQASINPVAPAAPVEPEGPLDWRATYRSFKDAQGVSVPVWYVAVQNTTVKPADGKGPEVALHIGDRILIGGTFIGPDGKIQLRPEDAANKFLWHGVADEAAPNEIIAPETKVYSTKTTPAERKVIGNTTINDRLIFLADDIQRITGTLRKVWDVLPRKKTKKSTIKK